MNKSETTNSSAELRQSRSEEPAKKLSKINFNHINEDNEHSETLQDFYLTYHKKEWCFNQKFKKYKKISFTIDTISAIIVGISTSTAITLTPITSIISILSIVLQYLKKKLKFTEKAENYKQATILINRILVELKNHIREESCDIKKIIDKLKIYDDKLLDLVKIPNTEKYEKLYQSKFSI